MLEQKPQLSSCAGPTVAPGRPVKQLGRRMDSAARCLAFAAGVHAKGRHAAACLRLPLNAWTGAHTSCSSSCPAAAHSSQAAAAADALLPSWHGGSKPAAGVRGRCRCRFAHAWGITPQCSWRTTTGRVTQVECRRYSNRKNLLACCKLSCTPTLHAQLSLLRKAAYCWLSSTAFLRHSTSTAESASPCSSRECTSA